MALISHRLAPFMFFPRSWRCTQEENLRAALLLEQAALCLLRVQPPHLRKFAFHMVLAGLRFNAAGQQRLGIRAYKCAMTCPAP